jgi:signal transduction histidine kinase
MRGRLTLIFAISIAIFMVLLCASVVAYSRRLEATQLAQSLEAHAALYRRDLHDEKRQPRTGHDWQNFLERENRTLRDFPLSMLVLNKKQEVVARTHSNGVEWPLGGDWLVETIPTRDYTLILAARWHSTQRELRQLSFNLSLVTLGVIVATALGSWLLVGRVLSPIDRLSRQAQHASAEDWRVRLQIPSRDIEVMGLVDTLNGLLDRLARTVESRGRFYAAASHELRTPIQGLSALLEVGLSRRRNADQWQEIATQALDESRRLSALTQDLLFLNQLDNQTVAPPASEVDAADIIERIVGQLETQIEIKNLDVSLDLPDEADMSAPQNHLEMLFRNLIENAVKYARDGGNVRIVLNCQNRTAHFSVWNSADLPSDFEAEKLFEPFFRLDAARQSQTGGNGLGLSLVAALCRANGWTPLLKSENHGMLAEVELPDLEAETKL